MAFRAAESLLSRSLFCSPVLVCYLCSFSRIFFCLFLFFLSLFNVPFTFSHPLSTMDFSPNLPPLHRCFTFFFHISFHPSIHSNLGNQILPHHSSCIRYHIIAEWKHLYRLSILAHIKQNKITKKKSHLCKKSLYVVFFPKWGS